MQSQFEAHPEFKAIYEAALTQDQTKLEEALKEAQIDVTHLISYSEPIVSGLISNGFFKKIYHLLALVEQHGERRQFNRLLNDFAYQIALHRSKKEIEQFYTTIESRSEFTKSIPFFRGSLINGLTHKREMKEALDLLTQTLFQFRSSPVALLHLAISIARKKNQFAIVFLIEKASLIVWDEVLGSLIESNTIEAAYELSELINQHLPEKSRDLTLRLVREFFNPGHTIQRPINKTVVLNGLLANEDLDTLPSDEEFAILNFLNYPSLANLKKEFARLLIIMHEHHLTYNQIVAWRRPEIQIFLLQFIHLIGRNQPTLPLYLNISHPIYFNIASFLTPLNLVEFSDLAKKYVIQFESKFQRYSKHAAIYDRIFFPSGIPLNQFERLPWLSSPFEQIRQAAENKDNHALQNELNSVSINILHKEKLYPPIAEVAALEDIEAVDFLLTHKASKGWAVYGYAKTNPTLAYAFLIQELKQAPHEVRYLLRYFARGLTEHQGDFSEVESFLNWLRLYYPEELTFVLESIAFSIGVNGENLDQLGKQFPDQSLSHNHTLGLIRGKHPVDFNTLFSPYLHALRSSNDQIKNQAVIPCKDIIFEMTSHGNRYNNEINTLYEIIQTLANSDQRDEFISCIVEGFARNGQGLEEDFIRTLKQKHPNLVSKAKSRIPLAYAWMGKIDEAIQSLRLLPREVSPQDMVLSMIQKLIETEHCSDPIALVNSLISYCPKAELEHCTFMAFALARNMTKCIELWTDQLDLSLARQVIGLLVAQHLHAEACILLRHCFKTHDALYFKAVFLHHVSVFAKVQTIVELKIFLECRFLEQYNQLKEGLECMTNQVGLHHSTSDFIEFFTKIVTMYPKHVIPVFLYCVESLIRSKKFQSLLSLLKVISQQVPYELTQIFWLPSAYQLLKLNKAVEMHELLDVYRLFYPPEIILFLDQLKFECANSPILIEPSLFFETLVLCKDPGIYQVFNQLVSGFDFFKMRLISRANQFISLAHENNMNEEELIGWMQPQMKVLLLEGIVLINPKQLTSNMFLDLISFLIPIQKLASPIQTQNRVCQISKSYVMSMYPGRFFKHKYKSHFDNLMLLDEAKDEHIRPEAEGEREQKRVKRESFLLGSNP